MFPLHEPLTDTLREKLAEYDDLTSALLARRGIVTKEDAEKFLNPSYDLHLHDKFLMTDMKKAARRFADAIILGERIAIWSDYDCDGIPGAVLMHDFLKKAGANFENYIPHRHDEGYGMNAAGVEKLAKSGVKLMVTVDSGITDIEPVARSFFDLWPVVSFLVLQGKCRYCRKKISAHYPLSELMMAILFVFFFYRFGVSSNTMVMLFFGFVLFLFALEDFLYLEVEIAFLVPMIFV